MPALAKLFRQYYKVLRQPKGCCNADLGTHITNQSDFLAMEAYRDANAVVEVDA